MKFDARSAVLAGLFALAFAAAAADPGKELLNAAHDGDTPRIRALLDGGANLEARDKNGKTPLMRAAEEGHAETVGLLLSKGAAAGARDKEGFTAYALALFSSVGTDKRESVLAALPAPPRLRVIMDADWLPESAVSSCFLSREDLLRSLGGLHPDALVLGALAEFARANGGNILEIVSANSAGLRPEPLPAAPSIAGADAAVMLDVRPGASCVRQSDNLTLAIDVRVFRSGGGAPVYSKTFGAGLKGLHAQSVTNAEQYPPFFEKWAKSHAGSIYSGVLRALLRE